MILPKIAGVGCGALAAAVLWGAAVVGRADQESVSEHTTRWEYKLEECRYDIGFADPLNKLNKLGADGWELVQIMDGMGVFKRPTVVSDDALSASVQIEELEELGVLIIRGNTSDVQRVANVFRQIGKDRSASTPANAPDGPPNPQRKAPRTQEKPAASHGSIYDKMAKEDLRAELARLQLELLTAERLAKEASGSVNSAKREYGNASDEKKAEALLRSIEAEAASRKPMRHYSQLRSQLDAARSAYLQLLLDE